MPIATLPNVHIHEGFFLRKSVSCANCKMKWQTYEEKMTDVNIAVELLGDAQDDVFDTAIVISGDGDLATPVRAVRKRYSKKRTIIAFPPGRHAAGLIPAASAYFTIGRDVLRDSQLPSQITKHAHGCLDAAPHLEVREAHGADEDPQETDRSRPAARQNKRRSSREKSIRHGHPSTLHLWWARRPLAAARAVLFAQLVDDPSDLEEEFPGEEEQEKERERLFGIIEELVLWENTTNERVLEEARAEIRRSWRRTCADNRDHPRAAELFDPEKLPAFHDPFAGGGRSRWRRSG